MSTHSLCAFPLFLALLLLSAPATAGWSVGGGYFGHTAAHPGVITSLTYQPEARRLFVAADIGAYWHPRAQLGLFSEVRAGWAYSGERGYRFDASAGLGYLHSLIAAETVNFKNTGYPGLMPLVEVGFLGWDLEDVLDRPMHAGAALRVLGQYPVNTHWVVHPALTLTVTHAL